MTADLELPDVDRWVLHSMCNGICGRCGTRYSEPPHDVETDAYRMAIGRPVEGGVAFVRDLGLVDGEMCDPAVPWPPPIRLVLRNVEMPLPDLVPGVTAVGHRTIVAAYEDAWDGDLTPRYVEVSS